MDQKCIYHILIDRFFPSKSKDDNGNFKGGCLRGIIDHLDYIQGLGMAGIMLTPFYRTAVYHGYHIVDFEQVDPHFGTKDDLKELIDKVHQRGMVIVADFVANHCHKDCALFSDGKHDDWFYFKRDGRCKCFADIPDLPMFNTKNKAVQMYLTDKALKLCRMGFDAIRLDHATGPSYVFWKYFKAQVKREYPNIKLIGEVWGGMDFKPRNYFRYLLNKIRYNAQEARQLEYVGVLDGVLDFRYQELLREAVRHEKSLANNRSLYRKVKEHLSHFPKSFQLWLFLDNHDLNRFLFECEGDRALLNEAIGFSKQWGMPYLMFYGTEKGLTNEITIFDGMPYADERVRMCLE